MRRGLLLLVPVGRRLRLLLRVLPVARSALAAAAGASTAPAALLSSPVDAPPLATSPASAAFDPSGPAIAAASLSAVCAATSPTAASTAATFPGFAATKRASAVAAVTSDASVFASVTSAASILTRLEHRVPGTPRRSPASHRLLPGCRWLLRLPRRPPACRPGSHRAAKEERPPRLHLSSRRVGRDGRYLRFGRVDAQGRGCGAGRHARDRLVRQALALHHGYYPCPRWPRADGSRRRLATGVRRVRLA
mmetsp:Transcript_24179/g.77608  ORF Transcript_24179/g.77608 Transcript_24179/m.77608 type:complete len:250 (-) Transcript_24179:238-987(-)